MSKILSIKHRVVHQFEVHTEGNAVPVLLSFHPVDAVPGFTHRLAVDGKATTKWLSEEFKPTKKVAGYFFDQLQKEKKK